MEEQKNPLYQLNITIRDPEKVIYTGFCDAVTASSDRGIFDVLPIHENFISIINEKVVIHIKDKKEEITLTKGILKVEENEVDVFVINEKIGNI